MNNKEHIQELILEEYYKIAVKDLFEQVERSAKIEKLDNKTQQLIQKSPASRGFKIVVRGRNLKGTISADRIRQMLSGSKQYGIDSVASQSGNMLYVIKNLVNKNRKVVWLVTIYELNRLDISPDVLDQYRKIGNTTIVDEKTFTEITKEKPKITKIQKVITNTATKEEEKKSEEKPEEKPEKDQEEAPGEDSQEISDTDLPTLSFKNSNEKNMTAGLKYGLDGNIKIAPKKTYEKDDEIDGELDGDYAGAKSTLLKFLSPLKDKIYITSTKRAGKWTGANNISDHWGKNLTSYAVDFVDKGTMETGVSTGETTIGDTPTDKVFKHIMDSLGMPYGKKGDVFNKDLGKFTIQVIWRDDGHYDHVHIGLTDDASYNQALTDLGWQQAMDDKKAEAEKEKAEKDKKFIEADDEIKSNYKKRKL
jgi:hypothetical protein